MRVTKYDSPEFKLAELIWKMEPISVEELVKICIIELLWDGAKTQKELLPIAIVTLILGNMVSGILMLVMKDEDLINKIEKFENANTEILRIPLWLLDVDDYANLLDITDYFQINIIEKLIEKDKPVWPQYLATEAGQKSISEDYQISGIPRFILIDKNGKIITVNAPRPSELDKASLKALLK